MRRAVFGLVLLGLLAACQIGGPERFVVYFTPWKSDLDAPAQQVVARVAELARQQPGATVMIHGYASPVGTASADMKLSAQRAQTVADTLVADGVAPQRIARVAEGRINYALDTIESRRVEITLGDNQQR